MENDRDHKYTRYLSELVGSRDPISNLEVMPKPPFDFEYQVQKHLKYTRPEWPSREEREVDIRKSLAVGQAWLWPEPQAVACDGHQMRLFE